MATKNQNLGAPTFMREKGRRTDAKVMKEIELHPGSTVHDIAERLRWSNGRVDGSVNRLVSRGKAEVHHHIRRGVVVKNIYPLEYISKPYDVIEIPINMIDLDSWKKTVHVYALSRSTIGLSPRRVDEWEKRALQKEKLAIERVNEQLRIRLPISLCDFYQLENSETSLSTTEDLAILTVEPILPVELPTVYPEEIIYETRATGLLIVETKAVSYLAPPSEVSLDVQAKEGEATIDLPPEPQLLEILEELRKVKDRLRTQSSESEAVVYL